jgi:AraC family transcriptional activator of tynA and feaB
MTASTRDGISPHAVEGQRRSSDWSILFRDSFLADEVWPLDAGPAVTGQMSRRWIDDLLLVDYTSSPYGGRHLPGSTAHDYVSLSMSEADGPEFVTLHDDTTVALPAGVVIYDIAALREFEQPVTRRWIVVQIPKSALRDYGVRPEIFPGLLNIEGSATARLLKGMVHSLTGETESFPASAASAIRNALLELVIGAASGHTDISPRRAASDALRQEIEHWIGERLRADAVSPAEAAAAHGLSVRSLHRLFADAGQTFGGVVRKVRAEGGKRDLALTNDTVQAIAMRWGYADASHFCREFKRQYGITTREFRRS